MRRHDWLALVGLLILPAGLRADLRFEQVEANAGVVYTGCRLVQRFTFVNAGAETVEITQARASCGCLAPRLSSQKIEPGGTGAVDMEVNTLTQSAGPHSWNVHLTCKGAAENKDVELRLLAKIVTEVTVQPAALVVMADRAAYRDLVLTDVRKESLTIKQARATSTNIQLKIQKPVRNNQGHWVSTLRLEVGEKYPDGRHEEMVDIYTNDPRYADLRIPVTVIKRFAQRLAATPAEVRLSGVAGQPLPSRIVLLRDNKNEAVRVEHVMSDDPAISCKWAAGPNNLSTLRVQIDRAKLQSNRLESAIHVQLNSPVRETITIPVVCEIK
jgi:hypothetical protein